MVNTMRLNYGRIRPNVKINGLTLKITPLTFMRRLLLFFITLYSTAPLSAQEIAKISATEISFNFISKDVEGSISGFNSSSSIILADFSESKLKGSVAVETIKTGNFLRDWSLKGRKYFDVDAHPKITFESNEISKTSDGFHVKGNLTIKGTEKPITLTFALKGDQLVGTTTLFSSDFGIAIKDKREDNEVKVNFVFSLKSWHAQ